MYVAQVPGVSRRERRGQARRSRSSAASARSRTGKPVRTVGSYWPYATTLFDYTRRAMPTTKPLSLTNDEVYAVTAYVLYLNGIIARERGDERADAAAGEDAEPRRVHQRLEVVHSYWFGPARKALKPFCSRTRTARWPIGESRVDLLGNSLAAPPSTKNAQAAWEALEKGAGDRAKTERERDWIEALSA